MRIPHVPALDGLRGLAVLAVVGFHANALLRGGYLGVDLFFVLSGYLITSILVREHERTGTIGLRAFWVRRARRLLPALLLLMPAVAIYALGVDPVERATLRGDALATLGYVANWRVIVTNKSYWEIFAAPSPLQHTWSLAIEEQFYVVWPLVVAAVLTHGKGKRTLALAKICVALGLASIVAMLALYDPDRLSRVYMGSDTRAVALLFGATLATFLSPGAAATTTMTFSKSKRAVRILDVLGFASLALLAIAWGTLDSESPLLYRGGFWVTEIAALVIIACAVVSTDPSRDSTDPYHHRTLVGRVLSARPLVFVGKISYGIYLWHWPVDVVITQERLHDSGSIVTNLVRLALTFAIAMASYRWIEEPIRRRGIFFGRAIVVAPASFAVVLLLVIVATRTTPAAAMTPNAPIHPPMSVPVTPTADVDGDVVEPGRRQWPDFHSVKSTELPTADELPLSRLAPGRTLRILVLGDSMARFLGEALRFQQAPAHAFVAQRGVGGCSIHESDVRYINGARIEGPSCAQSWVADVAELRPDVTFIVLGGAFLGPRTCDVGWRKAYNKRLSFLLHAISADSGRVILALVPYPVGERWRTSWNLLERVDCFNDELKTIAKAERVLTIDLMSHVCPTKECNVMSDGSPIRMDGLHFDGQGAAETARWTLSEINRLAARPPTD